MQRPVAALVLVLAAWGCAPFEPDFTVRPGVETATVLDGVPGASYTLYNRDDEALVTLVADAQGQAHFAYVPPAHAVIETGEGALFAFPDGDVLLPGEYEIRSEDVDPAERSGWFEVLSVDSPAPDGLYDSQELVGIEFSPLGDPPENTERGFQYLEMRDGVLLSAMVRFPDSRLYGDGPWPTVVEYSGYSPSNPNNPDNGTFIANAMGFATVSVNMRGSGCSGGVFDVFNRAQHADGYDIIEIVARQDWVLNNRVGMVGLSYPGISQLYVASTNPPSLGAIVPLSVIADAWEMQWPGGIYNKGFTRQWVEQRESDSKAGGTDWVTARIEGGDTTCEDNLKLSSQNIDFESFLRSLEMRPDHSDDRDLRELVRGIEAPVFLGGQWQDEQTGSLFGGMVDHFESSADVKFLLANGRHPDGYAPDAVFRWNEFLEFHLAERVPELHPGIKLFGGGEFGKQFQMEGYRFPDDRFEGMEYDAALSDYLAEPDVTVLFENGAGSEAIGAPGANFEADFSTWPPAGAEQRVEFWADADGTLADSVGASGVDAWRFDPDAGDEDFFGPRGYELMPRQWDIDWTRFAEGDAVSYLTPPFQQTTVLAGPAVAELWVRTEEESEVHVQVTLTEVRPDGNEVLIQSGWLRLGHRKATVLDDLRVDRSYAAADFEAVPLGEFVRADVAIHSFAHPVRQGSRLRMTVSAPGRDHGTWLFEAPPYDTPPTFHLGRGGDHPTALRISTLSGLDVPEALPDCTALRGQPCREYVPIANTVVE